MKQFENPPLDAIRTLLQQVHTIAVIGLSPRPNRPSHQVAASMQRFGYRIIPVRPAVSEVLGEPAYRDLHEVTEAIDLVNVFRAPQHIGEIVDTCIALKLPALWLQDGVIDQEAAWRARDAGVTVVMNRCIYRDYLATMK